jgi:hypothetical protein
MPAYRQLQSPIHVALQQYADKQRAAQNGVHVAILSIGSLCAVGGVLYSAVLSRSARMLRKSLTLLIVYGLLAGLAPASADTLLIEGLQSASSSSNDRPVRGMSMDTVQSRWGQPLTQRGAVGEPPISRWEYGDFIVFFEYQRVIHAIRKN